MITTRSSQSFLTRLVASFITTSMLVTVSDSNTWAVAAQGPLIALAKGDPSRYGTHFDDAHPSDAIQTEAYLASIQGQVTNEVGFLTWAQQLPNVKAEYTNVAAAAAATHPQVAVGVSGSGLITPEVLSTEQQNAALMDPQVQRSLTENKGSWGDISVEVIKQRIDLQIREVRIQMEAARQRAEAEANIAEGESKDADQILEKAEAQSASVLNYANATSYANALYKLSDQAELHYFGTMKTLREVNVPADDEIQNIENQIKSAPPQAQQELTELVSKLKDQKEASLKLVTDQSTRASEYHAHIDENYKRMFALAGKAVGAPPSRPDLPIGSLQGPQGFAGIMNAIRHPSQYVEAWKNVGIGVGMFAASGVLTYLLAICPALAAGGFQYSVLMGVIAGSGYTWKGLSTMWNGNPVKPLFYYSQSAPTPSSRPAEWGIVSGNDLMQKAGNTSQGGERPFQEAVRSALQNNTLDRTYSDTDKAIGGLSESIASLQAGTQSIGKSFVGFNGLTKGLYNATGNGDQIYHALLGEPVPFAALE